MVYLLERFKVKPALLGFNKTDIDYELELNEDSVVTLMECDDTAFCLPEITYINIVDINSMDLGKSISKLFSICFE